MGEQNTAHYVGDRMIYIDAMDVYAHVQRNTFDTKTNLL